VLRWLLDSDPAICWQVMRDLTDAPAHEIAAERAKAAIKGWAAHLLSLQAADGRWGGAAWNHGWDSTMHVLWLLRLLGLDPASAEARLALGRVRDHVTWKGSGPSQCECNSFFTGEIEPCINGQVATAGAYFGQDVRDLVHRLLGEQLSDGGWNCEAPHGSTRSSFNTTICVLEALLEYERAVGATTQVTEARLRGQDYLLERRLFRRRRPERRSSVTARVARCGHISLSPPGGITTCCGDSSICAPPASHPMSASLRRSIWSYRSATSTAGGRSRRGIPA
jgi:hypothetical protein